MSFVQQSVLPLSFSVERLLQHSASSGSRKPEKGGGSLGSASDLESTPPSSPASSCNFIDTKEMQSTTPTFGGQVLLNAPGFATLPCIPLSAFTWHPSAALPSSSPQTPLSYRVMSGVGASSGVPHLTTTYPSVNIPLHGRLATDKLLKTRTESRALEAKPRSKGGSNLQPTPPKLLRLSSTVETSSEHSSAAVLPYHRTTISETKPADDLHHLQESDHDSSSFKKKRTTFTSSQLESLEIRFSQQKYLTKHDRTKLASSLGLTEKHIKTWYQNRRTKWKRECSDEVWSKERETAAAAMYAQHLQLKSSPVEDSDDKVLDLHT